MKHKNYKDILHYRPGIGNWRTAEGKTLDPVNTLYLIMLFSVIVLLLIEKFILFNLSNSDYSYIIIH